MSESVSKLVHKLQNALHFHIPKATSCLSSSCRAAIAQQTTSARRSGAGTCQRVLGKHARERLLAADLLATDEALDSDGDGAINVLRRYVFGETHAAK